MERLRLARCANYGLRRWKGDAVRFPRWLGDGFLGGELPPEPRLPPVPAEESQRDRCVGASGFDVAAECDLRNASRRFRAN
jgi:hypothetical protein